MRGWLTNSVQTCVDFAKLFTFPCFVRPCNTQNHSTSRTTSTIIQPYETHHIHDERSLIIVAEYEGDAAALGEGNAPPAVLQTAKNRMLVRPARTLSVNHGNQRMWEKGASDRTSQWIKFNKLMILKIIALIQIALQTS